MWDAFILFVALAQSSPLQFFFLLFLSISMFKNNFFLRSVNRLFNRLVFTEIVTCTCFIIQLKYASKQLCHAFEFLWFSTFQAPFSDVWLNYLIFALALHIGCRSGFFFVCSLLVLLLFPTNLKLHIVAHSESSTFYCILS